MARLQRRVVERHLPAPGDPPATDGVGTVGLIDETSQAKKGDQVHLQRDGQPTDRTYWLIVARNVATGEVKYFVSNAPPHTPPVTLLRVAFSRWGVEHAFRLAKTEVGFGHFEGRSWLGLMRHMILCQLVLLFVAERAGRLRGGKTCRR